MSAFSISSADILQRCRYPFRPDVVVPYDDTPNAARDKGTEVHAAGATYVNSGKMRMTLGYTHATWSHMKEWLDAEWRDGWVAEPAYAWDPVADSARQIGVDIGRKYAAHGKLEHEIAGTCDLVLVGEDCVYVWEFGTGFDVSHKVEQLKMQCLVVARAHGKDRAVGQLVRFRDDGATPWAPIALDAFDLAALAGEYAALLTDVVGAEPRPGDHCSRCNAAPVCPAMQRAAGELVPVGALTHRFTTEIQSPEHARWMLERVDLVRNAADKIRDALKAYAQAHGGIDTGDGKTWREVPTSQTRFDQEKALATMREHGVSEARIAECFYKTPVARFQACKKGKAA